MPAFSRMFSKACLEASGSRLEANKSVDPNVRRVNLNPLAERTSKAEKPDGTTMDISSLTLLKGQMPDRNFRTALSGWFRWRGTSNHRVEAGLTVMPAALRVFPAPGKTQMPRTPETKSILPAFGAP